MAMTKLSKEEQYGPVVLECVSSSDPNKMHQVRCKNGHFSCNCMSWIFCKAKDNYGDKFCKHTTKARALWSDSIGNKNQNELESHFEKHVPLVEKLLNCIVGIDSNLTPGIRDLMRSKIKLLMLDVLWEHEKNHGWVKPVEPEETFVLKSGVRRIVFED